MLAVILGGGCVYLYTQRKVTPVVCSPPDRPAPVPADAKWAGGCDGGYWIEAGRKSDRGYFVRIFSATFGKVEQADWFEWTPDCKNQPSTKTELLERLNSFDGGMVCLRADSEVVCCLRPKKKRERP